jgi:hypothetical protein
MQCIFYMIAVQIFDKCSAMRKVNQRDFQIKFYAYSKGCDVVEVVGRGGRVVGIWTPVLVNTVQESDNAVHNLLGLADEERGVVEPDAVQDKMEDLKNKYDIRRKGSAFGGFQRVEARCDKCGGPAAGTVTEYDFELGEERNGKFCIKCAKERGVKLTKIDV